MTKTLRAVFVTVFTLSMLLPAVRQVNAESVNSFGARQSGNPLPGGTGGGHFTSRQSGNPLPGGTGGGH